MNKKLLNLSMLFFASSVYAATLQDYGVYAQYFHQRGENGEMHRVCVDPKTIDDPNHRRTKDGRCQNDFRQCYQSKFIDTPENPCTYIDHNVEFYWGQPGFDRGALTFTSKGASGRPGVWEEARGSAIGGGTISKLGGRTILKFEHFRLDPYYSPLHVNSENYRERFEGQWYGKIVIPRDGYYTFNIAVPVKSLEHNGLVTMDRQVGLRLGYFINYCNRKSTNEPKENQSFCAMPENRAKRGETLGAQELFKSSYYNNFSGYTNGWHQYKGVEIISGKFKKGDDIDFAIFYLAPAFKNDGSIERSYDRGIILTFNDHTNEKGLTGYDDVMAPVPADMLKPRYPVVDDTSKFKIVDEVLVKKIDQKCDEHDEGCKNTEMKKLWDSPILTKVSGENDKDKKSFVLLERNDKNGKVSKRNFDGLKLQLQYKNGKNEDACEFIEPKSTSEKGHFVVNFDDMVTPEAFFSVFNAKKQNAPLTHPIDGGILSDPFFGYQPDNDQTKDVKCDIAHKNSSVFAVRPHGFRLFADTRYGDSVIKDTQKRDSLHMIAGESAKFNLNAVQRADEFGSTIFGQRGEMMYIGNSSEIKLIPMLDSLTCQVVPSELSLGAHEFNLASNNSVGVTWDDGFDDAMKFKIEGGEDPDYGLRHLKAKYDAALIAQDQEKLGAIKKSLQAYGYPCKSNREEDVIAGVPNSGDASLPSCAVRIVEPKFINMVPYSFAFHLSKIASKDGNKFAYMYDLSQNRQDLISLRDKSPVLEFSVYAKNAKGNKLKNFTNSCYATDVATTINHIGAKHQRNKYKMERNRIRADQLGLKNDVNNNEVQHLEEKFKFKTNGIKEAAGLVYDDYSPNANTKALYEVGQKSVNKTRGEFLNCTLNNSNAFCDGQNLGTYNLLRDAFDDNAIGVAGVRFNFKKDISEMVDADENLRKMADLNKTIAMPASNPFIVSPFDFEIFTQKGKGGDFRYNPETNSSLSFDLNQEPRAKKIKLEMTRSNPLDPSTYILMLDGRLYIPSQTLPAGSKTMAQAHYGFYCDKTCQDNLSNQNGFIAFSEVYGAGASFASKTKQVLQDKGQEYLQNLSNYFINNAHNESDMRKHKIEATSGASVGVVGNIINGSQKISINKNSADGKIDLKIYTKLMPWMFYKCDTATPCELAVDDTRPEDVKHNLGNIFFTKKSDWLGLGYDHEGNEVKGAGKFILQE